MRFRIDAFDYVKARFSALGEKLTPKPGRKVGCRLLVSVPPERLSGSRFLLNRSPIYKSSSSSHASVRSWLCPAHPPPSARIRCFPDNDPHQPTARQTCQSRLGIGSILRAFQRGNIIAPGNSIVLFTQPCVSPKLTRTGLIGKIVYRRMHYSMSRTRALSKHCMLVELMDGYGSIFHLNFS